MTLYITTKGITCKTTLRCTSYTICYCSIIRSCYSVFRITIVTRSIHYCKFKSRWYVSKRITHTIYRHSNLLSKFIYVYFLTTKTFLRYRTNILHGSASVVWFYCYLLRYSRHSSSLQRYLLSTTHIRHRISSSSCTSLISSYRLISCSWCYRLLRIHRCRCIKNYWGTAYCHLILNSLLTSIIVFLSYICSSTTNFSNICIRTFLKINSVYFFLIRFNNILISLFNIFNSYNFFFFFFFFNLIIF